MDSRKKKALEAAGWRFGDAADFLEMTDEERQLLDARVQAGLAVRKQRELQKLSQKQLAVRIKTSQPRVAKIERAASDVSLDQILRAFAAVGGRIALKQVSGARPTDGAKQPGHGARKKVKAVDEAEIAEINIELIASG